MVALLVASAPAVTVNERLGDHLYHRAEPGLAITRSNRFGRRHGSWARRTGSPSEAQNWQCNVVVEMHSMASLLPEEHGG